ncbi:hypothetical protein PILCRDRAFT_660881 [Piloderma croceum F 1598]|uniref:Uncharacterized protein n=1 Tax=Piloderma croceum (strain F 1598) TaxID=765440 RepID=A0A0C3APX2_PILCF|nr:hypothetical protein PILCRDRAFT_660881 [Piloderma croceum F 1598]
MVLLSPVIVGAAGAFMALIVAQSALGLIGFSLAAGPVAGSLAARAQREIGLTGQGSLFFMRSKHCYWGTIFIRGLCGCWNSGRGCCCPSVWEYS